MQINLRPLMVLALLCAVAGSQLRAADGGKPVPDDGLNLPQHYRQLIGDRAIIDRFQLRHRQVEPAPEPVPLRPVPKAGAPRPVVRVVVPRLGERTLAYRAEYPDRFLPLRGFRAPILEGASNQPPAVLFEERLSAAEIKAAELVNRRLAHDGLLSTLAQIVQLIGPNDFLTNRIAAADRLLAIGFPADLLACFPVTRAPAPPVETGDVVALVARRLASGAKLDALQAELSTLPFVVPETWTGFRVASESGEAPLAMLRMQFGGGYRDGIVPGDCLDVIGQMLQAMPDLEFVVSVPRELSRPFQTLALRSWGVPERTRLTVIEEPFVVKAWAQDSGKAGAVMDPVSGVVRRATLAPRYASRDEGISSCLSGESFLMDGLAAAGEKVIQFPLLFQGGNLICVTVPEPRERVLLLSEADVHRNVALGLTHEQIVESFRRGFGVDRCIVVPAVSYHLDFDLSVRVVEGRPVVFVNDPLAAARVILRLGVEAMKSGGDFADDNVDEIVNDLRGGPGDFAHERIERALAARLTTDDRYPADLAKSFAGASLDSAAGNLQCFLQALDVLALSFTDAGDPLDGDRDRFLAALRRIEDARQAQLSALANTGWQIVPVPSMPNLFRSINYLNGIHHPAGFLMPAFGGFYSPLDRAAETAIGAVIGSAKIKSIQCAELQRYFGGVRCAVGVYPAP